MQQRPNFNILKIQGQLLTVIANALRQLGRIHFLGFNFHNELVIALIGTVNPQAFRLYHHANPVTRLECCDRLHRGTKIGNIQAPAEAFRESGFHELHNQGLTLLPDVHPDLVIWQRHNNSPRSFSPTTKVKILQWQRIPVLAFRKYRGSGCGSRRRADGCIQHHQQRLALYLRLVRGCLLQIQHNARPITRLNHTH